MRFLGAVLQDGRCCFGLDEALDAVKFILLNWTCNFWWLCSMMGCVALARRKVGALHFAHECRRELVNDITNAWGENDLA